ncbi:hypothetical protein JCM10908_000740 [Rhodotorula pacifica]|uniref:mRNA-processing endoribonuclease n=1 Tax=Rhodotorula pacifica TaxID=1495444 RepID=UPI00317E74C2
MAPQCTSREDARRIVAGALRLATAQATWPHLVHKAIDLALQAVDAWITSSEGSSTRSDTTARARRTLLDLQDRTSTYEALYVAAAAVELEEQDPKTPRIRHGRTFSVAPSVARPADVHDAAGAEDADETGWGDDIDLVAAAADSEPTSVNGDPDADAELPPPPSLAAFLSTPLPLTALSLASLAALPELCLLCSLHPAQLWPYRTEILEAIPLWADPQAYVDLLPEVEGEPEEEEGDALEREEGWADPQPWRAEADWSEMSPHHPGSGERTEQEQQRRPRPASVVRAWYLVRIAAHVDVGFVDEALSLIQHGAARNVTGLEETGEDVSLLARLVHDRPAPPVADLEGAEDDRPISLERWRALTPLEVIDAYTATCRTDNLAQTIKSLVLPYLHVLQARTERRRSSIPGHLDPDTSFSTATNASPTTFLYEYILSLPTRPPRARGAPSGLELFLAIVEASIPTLPASQRLIASDTDLARLAIAALYGAGRAGATNEAAVVMSRVFECLPAFDSPVGENLSSKGDSAGADLFSLGSRAGVSAPSPKDIFHALSSASPAALSAHLDTLDLHLSQLETFLRYSSPPSSSGLAWFLSSYRDRAAQIQWATRLARTASTGGGGRHGDEGEFESENQWIGLMDFMADATGVAQPSAEGSLGREEAIRDGLGRAFCLLERDEVLRIFFGGLLAAGRFALARSLFDPTPSSYLTSSQVPPLPPKVIEELVISASREFYDNAESGNLHSDEMKLAMECLSAAPQQTPAIRRERDFIEATSKLCSYRLDSRPGIALTPIELRHASDRLAFISRLLSANPQVAKHPDMVIELSRKLTADKWTGAYEVRVLTMLSEASTASGDWNLASEMCGRIVRAVEALRKRAARTDADSTEQQDAETAAEQAWRACFQLGKHDGWTSDPRKKLDALGQALTLCPPERIQDILPAWNKLELQVAQEALLSEKEKEAKSGKGRATAPPGAAHAAETAARAAASAAAGATAAGAARVAGFLAAAAARGANVASGSGSNASSTANTPSSPRSFTPMQASRLASPTSATHAGASASHLAHETAAAASHTFRRAAAFFGGGGGGGSTHRAEPASPSRVSIRSDTPSTPPRSPARAPSAVKLDPAPPPRTAGSRFAAALGGITDPAPASRAAPTSPPRGTSLSPGRTAAGAGGGSVSGFGLRAGLSNTLTAGVGWLIGADEMLEEERRFREEEKQERERIRRTAAAEQEHSRLERETKSRPLAPAASSAPSPRSSSPAALATGAKSTGRTKLGAKPVGRTKLQATKVVTPAAVQESSPTLAKSDNADADDWDACSRQDLVSLLSLTTVACSSSAVLGFTATLAPYASSYIPPTDEPVRSGPVSVTLALGPHDEENMLMDVEFQPPQAEVLAAVQSIRHQDGHVRMDLDFPENADSPTAGGAFSIAVVDTNILISYLALLRAFVRLAEDIPTSHRPLLFVPQVVLTELDGLKTSSRSADYNDVDRAPSTTTISALARSAIGWLLSTMSSGSTVLRGQKRIETLLPHVNGSRLAEDNDTLVLDAAMWCWERRVAQNVALLTDDRNLQLRATVEGLQAYSVADQRNAANLVALLSEAPARAVASSAPKATPRTSRYAGPPPRSGSGKPPSPRLRPRDQPSLHMWQAPSRALLDSSAATNDKRAKDPSIHAKEEPNGSRSQDMHAGIGDEHGSNLETDEVIAPPLYVDLPPPPLVAVENVADVFYNISSLVSHFIALPIYRHIHQYLGQTRPSEQRAWLAELGDWQRWYPDECVSRARTYWEDGDVQGLCQVGLDYAYADSLPSSIQQNKPLPPPTPEKPTMRANGSSKWSAPMSSPAPPAAKGARQPYLPHPIPPAPPTRHQRTPPKLAHIYRDLPLVRDFLAANPNSILSWSAPRWEVVIETTGLFLVAVLGGTFKADVRSEVDEIVRAWVVDLQSCGITIDVQL